VCADAGGWPRSSSLGDLGAQLGCPLGVQGGAQSRPHRGLLELDVLPGGPDERAEQLLELRVAGVELGQYFLGFLLLSGQAMTASIVFFSALGWAGDLGAFFRACSSLAPSS
jgi:hypothetical protein